MKSRGLLPGAQRRGGRGMVGRTAAIAVAALLAFLGLGQPATLAGDQPQAKGPRAKVSSGRAARLEAIRQIPWEELDEQAAANVRYVVENAGLFRRLPAQSIECDPTFFTFLLEHPDVVVNIWRVLKLSDGHLRRVEEGVFRADDRSGTTGSLCFVHRGENLHVVYGEGRYEGQLLARPVRGQCVLVLHTDHAIERDGRAVVTCRIDAFVHLENVGVDVLARTFQPLLGRTADHNLRETAQFVAMLHRAAEINQEGVLHVAERLTDVADEDRRRFVELAEQVAVQAALLASEEATARRAAGRPAGTRTSR